MGNQHSLMEYGVNQVLALLVALGVVQDGKKIGVQRVEIPAA